MGAAEILIGRIACELVGEHCQRERFESIRGRIVDEPQHAVIHGWHAATVARVFGVENARCVASSALTAYAAEVSIELHAH
jgi:hypothetical protein